MVDPEAGVILADKALAAVLGLAKREGVKVKVFDMKIVTVMAFRLGMGVKWLSWSQKGAWSKWSQI